MEMLTGPWLSEIQFAAALFCVLLMLVSPVSGIPATSIPSYSAMLIANATILVTGGAINRFAKFQLRRSLFDPEIRELAGHAQWSAKPCQNELPPTQLLIAVFATVFLSFIGTTPLVGSSAWFWRAGASRISDQRGNLSGVGIRGTSDEGRTRSHRPALEAAASSTCSDASGPPCPYALNTLAARGQATRGGLVRRV